MRALVTTFSSTSHFFPMVPLCWALRSAGHDVRVACGPALVDDVVAAGFTPSVLDDEVDTAAIWARPHDSVPELDHLQRERQRAASAMRMFTAVAFRTADQLLALARQWRPDLVLFEPRAYAGPIVAAQLGVPAVRQLYGIDYTYGREEEESEALQELSRWSGLPSLAPHGTVTVDPCPPTLQVRSTARRVRTRYIPYNGRAVVPKRSTWVRDPAAPRSAADSRPTICVTWGTTVTRYAGNLDPAIRSVTSAAAVAQVILAVGAGQRSMLGPVPAAVTVVEGVALHLLLPDCDLVIHQGGAGTLMTAVMCGVPQLVIPALADRFLNADRIAACGAGLSVLEPAADADTLSAAIDLLLQEPRFPEAAARLQAQAARQPAPAQLVPYLVELAESAPPSADPRSPATVV